MKKILIIFFLLLIPIRVYSLEDLTSNSKSSILLEPSTKTIIYEKNSHERLSMASMTKIMTLLLTFEALENNQITLEDKVTISDKAAGMGGSQMFLQPGMQISVHDLIKGIAVSSGNDAAVAIAEFIAGSESSFVDLMNEKVKSLGLGNTNFENSHGLDSQNHYSSAYDMAMIAVELLKYPSVLNYTSIYEETFMKPDGTNVWLVNSNKLVRFHEEIDGLKTGYTSNAGYCLTATGYKNNIRLLSVVMGLSSNDLRTIDTMNMMNYGFNSYSINTIIKSNETIKEISNPKANTKIELTSLENITNIYKTSDKTKQYSYKIELNKYKLPIKQYEPIGKIIIYENDKQYKEIEAVSKYTVTKKSLFKIFKYILMNNFI